MVCARCRTSTNTASTHRPLGDNTQNPLSTRTGMGLILCLTSTLSLFSASSALATGAASRPVRWFDDVATAPDGSAVATIEHDEPTVDGVEPVDVVVIRSTVGGAAVDVQLPCGTQAECKPSGIVFSADSRRVDFILRKPSDDRSYIDEVNRDGSGLSERLSFSGTLSDLQYAPNGKLAVLATGGARKDVGAVKPGAALAGEIGVNEDEQRIAIVDGGVHFASPRNLYVYEYSWRPDGSGFIATASPGNGDNSWWVARLWSFSLLGSSHVIYTPPSNQQIASPRVSPDGRDVAFIGGIMSDFGSDGGDAFALALDEKSKPLDLTPGLAVSVTALSWQCSRSTLTATALSGANAEILALSRHAAARRLWSGEESLTAKGGSPGVACGGSAVTAVIHETFEHPPELEVGPIGSWIDITHVNAGMVAPVVARSLTWKSDRFSVQGWLVQPTASVNSDDQRMITIVHGGPGAASTPQFMTDQTERWLIDAGYDLFYPNPRGSFGQGEAFTLANVRDFGHGDLRDILSGVNAAERAAPINPEALGLMGYSYGGYMAMWAVTQTTQFKAAVAGAGVSDWLSYYGEDGIDRWMIPFFGASVYDDPAIYAKSSPINFIKRVRTPTFEYVGDRDIECPMPQSQEFWHALKTLDVPTEFVVYPGQGHELHDANDVADAKRRTLAWFARWLKTPTQ